MNERVTEPLRLGLSLAPSTHISVQSLVELAQLAEQHRYESIWIPETWGFDAGTVLAVLACKTTRIKLASGVFNVFSRSPALAAQMAASLQEVSAGRFILGLGSSGPRVIEGWHGTSFEHPVERTRDYIAIIRLALAGARVDYNGEVLHVSGFTLTAPKCGRVPIYVAALGPRNIRLAGEMADGWLPIFAPVGAFPTLVSALNDSVQSSGREPGCVDIAAYLPALISGRGQRLLKEQLAYYVGGMGTYYRRFLSNSGLRDQARAIHSAWNGRDRRTAVAEVSDAMLEQCALGSTREDCVKSMARFQAAGLRLPIVMIPHGASAHEAADTIVALAPER